ncbi:MAG: AMP-binding protein [Alphaproteobacteria bacterium]|jgi:fatty-acyl-CoA synthase|nr:AMP-binding protein [Alphaproteobacteria bacterium]
MNLSDWIERQAAFLPDKTAIHFEGWAIGYETFAEQIRTMARGLKGELGIGPGDRVAFLGYNSPVFLALVFATARLGAMVVPLNWRLAGPEHDYILGDAGASALFVEQDFQALVEGIRAGHPNCRLVAVDFEAPGWTHIDAFEATVAEDSSPGVGYETPHLIVYTSGTTGRPKGAVLSQEALFWNAVNSTHLHDLSAEDVVLTALPLFHVGGLNNQTLPAFHVGATVVLQPRFEPAATLAAIESHAATLAVLVPATIQAVIDRPEWEDRDISSLRSMTTGSSVVPHHLIEAFHARGVPVLQIYGTTETAPIAAYLRPEDSARKLGTTGKAALHSEVRIVDEADNVVGPGVAGEIQVRGRHVMLGYWNNEEATAAAFDHGWFRTGDIGEWDADGFLVVNDRKADVIISGSENIYPAELELVLHAIEGVAEAAVVGRADARWSEVPVAVVVPAAGGSLDKARIIAAFEGRLARFKHPQDVVFRDSLPRNAMGKVQKFVLKDMI